MICYEYGLNCFIINCIFYTIIRISHTFRNVIFSFSFFFSLLWCSELQAPIRPEALAPLWLWTGFFPHEFGGRVSQNGIRTFHFQNTHSGTDVFYRDYKMKFRNRRVWVMFWCNMVRDPCLKWIPADNHSLFLWKLVYNTVFVYSTMENIKATKIRNSEAGAPERYVN